MAERKNSRETLINNATYLFYDIGFEATTMRLIAEKSGITHPALFHRFKNKAQIASELVQRFLKGLKRLTEIYTSDEGIATSDDRALLFYWTAYFHYCRYDANLFRFITEFSNSCRREYDAAQNSFFIDNFGSLISGSQSRDEKDDRLHFELITACGDVLAKAVYRGSADIAKAVEEITNIVYSTAKIPRSYSSEYVRAFVDGIDKKKYLSYSALENFLITNLDTIYDDYDD